MILKLVAAFIDEAFVKYVPCKRTSGTFDRDFKELSDFQCGVAGIALTLFNR